MEHVIIAGAGQAGAGAALKLRELGFAGRITLLGAETVPPYERPELSKGYAQGAVPFEKLVVLTQEAARAADIDLRLGTHVGSLDRAARIVRAGGETLAYTHLVLATGGRARRLTPPEGWQAPLLAIRDVSDANALATELTRVSAGRRRAVVIGGGWLGLEAAATCRAAGFEVHVAEMSERLCARVAPRWLSERLATMHLDAGNTLHLGVSPALADGRSVRLGTDLVEADLVIAAIGMQANDEVARGAGLDCEDGILVDAQGRTADPAVFAIGDCARYRHRGNMRRESWQNANQSAAAVAHLILGQEPPQDEPDWFWSTQFGHAIQMLGACDDAFEQVERAEPSGAGVTRFFLDQGCLRGVIAINAKRTLGMARRFVASGAAMEAADLANPETPLKDCMARPAA
ncbi:FAD-dependent oxidoreductase [Stappia taiwanensis]|uniref:FAD-dependent oxidoreductase n=1 Tax=Stappia taiwanensis TaxID=992267 RepID=A0A838XX27_9HYPH|nr:FAD-dependent oxidoreductase [Stappia taiwanensis]MBA4611594.1 FAD-dependent oxidoreductase [Stappia taiwanensis]GGE98399.1 pyridine nucleotide-disulfide oxidoreductase [Stappia taiwanensis]